jgi:hypothetical protein
MIIVDRIEGKFAVCETDGGMKNIPVNLIRGKVRDGAMIVEREGFFAVDEKATAKREADIRDSSNGIWR